MSNYKNNQRGYIKWLIMLGIAIVLASYFFDFSIKEAVEDERTQENFEYVKDESKSFYDKHLREKIDTFRTKITAQDTESS